MPGRSALVRSIGADTLMRSTRSTSSGVSAAAGPKLPAPAQLTSTSTRPPAASAAAARPPPAPGSARSHGSARPFASAATAASAASSRPETSTSAPASPSATAVARPIPLVAPVTRQTVPDSSTAGFSRFSGPPRIGAADPGRRRPALRAVLASSLAAGAVDPEWHVVLEQAGGEHPADRPAGRRGAGTGLSGGALPVAEGVVISLARLDRILAVDLERERVVCEPGVTNLAISRAVAADGFYYAPDPSSQQVCTIGGNVAENSGGAHCLKYGFTVNHVLAADVVL